MVYLGSFYRGRLSRHPSPLRYAETSPFAVPRPRGRNRTNNVPPRNARKFSPLGGEGRNGEGGHKKIKEGQV